ncbi:MAG: (Fe-S)-binding protein [Desulfomonilaceae bacterium]
MAHLLFFSREEDFQAGLDVLSSSQRYLEVIEAPRFCAGLAPPVILLSGRRDELRAELTRNDVAFCGLVQHLHRTTRQLDGEPPRPIWKEILGGLIIESVRDSASDPTRLRIELRTQQDFGALIPLMAALIRGGAYNPQAPSLALEEGHRLIAFSPDSVVISRCDDVYDFWFQLRCSVELICQAFEKKPFIEPVQEPRQGIGAIEIFRRLPATNCGKCGFPACMEFAVALFTQKAVLDLCTPLLDEEMHLRRQSLLWLLQTLGLPRT